MTAASSGRLSTTLKSSWLDSRPQAGTLMSSRSTSYDLAHRLDGGCASLQAVTRCDAQNSEPACSQTGAKRGNHRPAAGIALLSDGREPHLRKQAW
jgi:hypothetical protein